MIVKTAKGHHRRPAMLSLPHCDFGWYCLFRCLYPCHGTGQARPQEIDCLIIMSEVTLILQAIGRGEKHSSEELIPLVYAELRRLAAVRMAAEPAGQTLQPTALVHEAWVRLIGGQAQTWENRAHFFAAAAEAMRRIMIERARRKSRIKHGGGRQRV